MYVLKQVLINNIIIKNYILFFMVLYALLTSLRFSTLVVLTTTAVMPYALDERSPLY